MPHMLLVVDAVPTPVLVLFAWDLEVGVVGSGARPPAQGPFGQRPELGVGCTDVVVGLGRDLGNNFGAASSKATIRRTKATSANVLQMTEERVAGPLEGTAPFSPPIYGLLLPDIAVLSVTVLVPGLLHPSDEQPREVARCPERDKGRASYTHPEARPRRPR